MFLGPAHFCLFPFLDLIPDIGLKCHILQATQDQMFNSMTVRWDSDTLTANIRLIRLNLEMN